MPITKKANRRNAESEDLVYYFNPDMLERDGVVFVEDFIKNTMSKDVFWKNFFPKKNPDNPPTEEELTLWNAGMVWVNTRSMLRFFHASDPMLQAVLKEYNEASEADKPFVSIKLSKLGLDPAGAKEDEIEQLRRELAELKKKGGKE